MFGRGRKYEAWGRVWVEMDRETGLPMLKDGWRWEVVRSKGPGGLDFWPLEVRLVDRDGGVIGSEGSMASAGHIRSVAIGIMGRLIARDLDEVRIKSLVGTYPPKVL